jgi:hypothetical protein
VRRTGDTAEPGDGRHVDDRASPLLLHDAERRARAVERPEEVDLDHPAPLGVVHPARHTERAPRPAEHRERRLLHVLSQRRAQLADAGNVREHVDAPPLRHHPREQPVDLAALRNVGRHRDRLTARRADFTGDALRALRTDVRNRHPRPLGRKPPHNRRPDPGSTPSNDGDAPLERRHRRPV